jgi:hypothetical protein
MIYEYYVFEYQEKGNGNDFTPSTRSTLLPGYLMAWYSGVRVLKIIIVTTLRIPNLYHV